MSVAILLTWIADGCPMNGSVVITTSLSPMAKSTDLAGDLNSKHDSIYKVKLKGKRGITGDVTAPNSAVVTAVGAEALAIVGIPDGRGVILGAGKEQITIPVVLEKRQWPLVPFHQYRPHLSGCGFPIRRQRKRSLKKTLVAALHLNQKQQRMRNRQKTEKSNEDSFGVTICVPRARKLPGISGVGLAENQGGGGHFSGDVRPGIAGRNGVDGSDSVHVLRPFPALVVGVWVAHADEDPARRGVSALEKQSCGVGHRKVEFHIVSGVIVPSG
nr:hypothetical protein DVH24_042731 [Ipomoea batatas]